MKKQFILVIIIAITYTSCVSQTTTNNMNNFTQTDWTALDENAIQIIGKEWMLIAAGSSLTDYNMMTASWGGLGWLWEKPVAFIFVRPQRHTFVYTEKEDYFTLTFFYEEHKEVLRKMGTVSGRDFDKMNYPNLTAFETPNGSIAFKEARIIIECKKIYASVIDENSFIEKGLSQHIYPTKDFHTMYIGEILNVWIRNE